MRTDRPASRRGPLRRAWKRLRERLLDRWGWLYGEAFFRRSERHKGHSGEAVAASLVARYAPASVVDVGCGTGGFLAPLAARGIDVLGLDRSRAARRDCHARGVAAEPFDLRADPPPARRFDLCLCFEVAEHLDPRHADRLVEVVCALAPRVLFTAAPPGQGGVGHFNEQPPEYWVARFAARGWRHLTDETEALRADWERAGVVSWLVANLLVFGDPRAL